MDGKATMEQELDKIRAFRDARTKRLRRRLLALIAEQGRVYSQGACVDLKDPGVNTDEVRSVLHRLEREGVLRSEVVAAPETEPKAWRRKYFSVVAE
jgi:hypothetical protein